MSDGGSDLTEYVVEMKSSNDSEFVVVTHVQADTQCYTANDLQKGKEYEFRVRAKNAVGSSSEAAELEENLVMAGEKAVAGMFKIVHFSLPIYFPHQKMLSLLIDPITDFITKNVSGNILSIQKDLSYLSTLFSIVFSVLRIINGLKIFNKQDPTMW